MLQLSCSWTHIDCNERNAYRKKTQPSNYLAEAKLKCDAYTLDVYCVRICTKTHSIRYYLMFSISMIMLLLLFFISLRWLRNTENEYEHVVNIKIILRQANALNTHTSIERSDNKKTTTASGSYSRLIAWYRDEDHDLEWTKFDLACSSVAPRSMYTYMHWSVCVSSV